MIVQTTTAGVRMPQTVDEDEAPLVFSTTRGECRPFNIKVVTIAPGYIATPLTRDNRYSMPFLMQPAVFADRAFDAIVAGTSYRVIPWQMGVVAKLLRVLPNALFDAVLAGRPRKHRQGQ